MNTEPIDIPSESQAVVVRDNNTAVGQALSISELHRNLEFVREVMRTEMKEGQDYGKIPGTGDRPTLLQPGAQKLLLTFNLTVEVKKETLREYPNFHREYEFTLTVHARNGKQWDGVGTCSTLEAKYRYRKTERQCPKCGQHTIIQGKAEYGGGWVCFKKKGGCGSKFAGNDPAITNQKTGKVEHENPPDYWGTVRKMAFKRALVHASINATNTSDLWTQDLEEMSRPEDTLEMPSDEPQPRARSVSPPTTPKPAPAHKAKDGEPDKAHLEKLRTRLLEALGDKKAICESFFRTIDWLMPNESIDTLELKYVPVSKEQFDSLMAALNSSGEPKAPYPINPEPLAPKKAKAKEEKPIEVPRDENIDPNSPQAPWRTFPVPFGKHAGVTLEQLDKAVLFGFWANFEVETEYNGKPKKSETIERDRIFRTMLDEAGKHYEFTKPEDKE